MESSGLWMPVGVAVVLLATGLPAYAVLMGVSSVLFAVAGLALGGLEWGPSSACWRTTCCRRYRSMC